MSPLKARCDLCDPRFGGNTRGKPNFKYVYIFEPSGDLYKHLNEKKSISFEDSKINCIE